MLWTDEHAPSVPASIVGNEVQATALVNHLTAWLRDPQRLPVPIVMLSGPPGVGKSASVAVAARKLGLQLVELNSSMQRTYDSLCQALSGYARLPGGLVPRALEEGEEEARKQALVVLEEVDGLDRGGTKYLYEFIGTTNVPIVLTCNLELRDPKMTTLAKKCTHTLVYKMPDEASVLGLLYSILARQTGRVLSAAERALAVGAYNGSNRDPRSAINRLQLLYVGHRDHGLPKAEKLGEEELLARSSNLFECGRAVFSGQLPMDQVMTEITSDTFLYCSTIWHNYPRQSNDIERILEASDAMSLSDTCEGAARYGSYACESARILAGPITAAFHTRRSNPVNCEFPALLSQMSRATAAGRATRRLASHMRCAHTPDTGGPYSVRDLCAEDLGKTICLCVARLLREDKLEAAADIMLHYGLAVEELEVLKKNASWLDPITGGTMAPTLPPDGLKRLAKRLKELRPSGAAPSIVLGTLPVDMGLDREDAEEEVEVVMEEEEKKKPQTSVMPTKRARKQ